MKNSFFKFLIGFTSIFSIGVLIFFFTYLFYCKKRFLYRNDNSILNNIQLVFFDLNNVNVINKSGTDDITIKCYFNTSGKKDSVLVFENNMLKDFKIKTGKGSIAFSVFKEGKEIAIFRQQILQNYYTHDYEFYFYGNKESINVDYKIHGPMPKFNTLIIDSNIIHSIQNTSPASSSHKLK